MVVWVQKFVEGAKKSTIALETIKFFIGRMATNSSAKKVRNIDHWAVFIAKIVHIGNVIVEGEDSMFTLPEYEIIIDDEKLEKKGKLSQTDEEQLKEFEQILKSKNPTFQNDDTINESLEQSVSDVEEDKMFLKFKAKIADYPDQVLRYGRGEKPLWVSDSNMPTTIPRCELCGSERKFEFQVFSKIIT